MRTRIICVACALGCLGGTAASAQELAWFLAPDSVTQIAVTNNGGAWSPVARTVLPNHSPWQPLAFDGGRYLVWAAYRPDFYPLARYDTRTRAVAVFPGVTFASDPKLAVDRQNDRLLVLDRTFLYVLDVEGLHTLRRLDAPFVAEGFDVISLGVAGGRAFVGHDSPWQPAQTTVIDVMTGDIVTTIPGVWNVQVARDDTRVYLQGSAADGIVTVQVMDPRSLAVTATATLDALVRIVGGAVISEMPSGVTQSFELRAHDPATLDIVYRMFVSLAPGIWVRDFQEAGPRSPIVLRTMDCSSGLCRNYCITVFDRATLTFVGEWVGAAFDAVGSQLVMVAPPEPPAAFGADVAGNVVGLEWNALADIGDYEVRVGTAPGVYDIGSARTGGVPRLRVAGVPSGTYYVRVRAINEAGSSESAELQVVVP
jgi:hypothetical protein